MDKFNLQAGFGRITINPHMGIDIVGYYKEENRTHDPQRT